MVEVHRDQPILASPPRIFAQLARVVDTEKLFLGLILLGFALRVVALAICGPYNLHHSDPYYYLQVARSLIAGNGLAVDDPTYGSQLRAWYPPVYPLFLAVCGSILGFSGSALIIMNGALDVVTASILRRYDWRAAAIYFLWPWNILGSFLAQKETLVCFFVVVLSHLAMKYGSRLTVKGAILFGMFAGLLALTQPGLLFFPAALSLLFFRRSSNVIKLAILAALAGLAVFLPWWIRNWLVFHTFVPLTTSAGASLAVVVNEGHSRPPEFLMRMGEVERFSDVGKLAVHHIEQHPLRYLHDVEAQSVNGIFQENFAITRAYQRPVSPLLTSILAAANVALLGLATLGRNRNAWLLLLAAMIALVPAIFMEFAERHRYFLLPLVALLAADTIRRIFHSSKDDPSGETRILHPAHPSADSC